LSQDFPRGLASLRVKQCPFWEDIVISSLSAVARIARIREDKDFPPKFTRYVTKRPAGLTRARGYEFTKNRGACRPHAPLFYRI
jgi:hypothetical protein